MSKKSWILKAFVIATTIGLPPISFAQMEVNDASLNLQQGLAYVQDGLTLLQVEESVKQLTTHTEQLAMELKTLDPTSYDWSNAQNLINDLGSTVNQTNSLSYSAANIGEKFAQMNPGYVASTDYTSQYKNNTTTTMNTINGALQSLGMSAQDFESENTRLSKLQTAAQTSTGQLQAIQASSQIASENVSQLQLLRQTMTVQANEQAVYHANQLQNEASSKAALDSIINAGSTEMKGYGTSGDVINIHG